MPKTKQDIAVDPLKFMTAQEQVGHQIYYLNEHIKSPHTKWQQTKYENITN